MKQPAVNSDAGCLAGARVVEYTDLVAGPWCAFLLAHLGAEVVKIERPGLGDDSRRRGPFPGDLPDQEKSGLFLYLNRSKLGITLDLESKAGQRLFRQLVATTDIFIEDRSPGFMAGLGLDYASLSVVNPRLIMASLAPFGQTGPCKDCKAYPLNVFQGGGEGFITPGASLFPERPPLQAGEYLGEYEAGQVALIAILGALYGRELLGKGQFIDISKQEAVMALNSIVIPRCINEGVTVSRATRGYVYGGILPCKDGYIQISIHREEEWQALLRVMGNPEWSRDERFKSHESRSRQGAEINRHLEKWLSNHTKEEVYQALQSSGCSAGAFYTPEEVMNARHLQERGFFEEIEHPLAPTLKYPAAPFKLGSPLQGINRPAPTLGEHNEHIFCGRLGLTRKELLVLKSSGVI